MNIAPPATFRDLVTQNLTCDLVVIGGGIAGTCAAITVARAGTKVFLIQDRPVLGGNASSEVRLWILGATAHMGNNNRWAREGGVIDELMVENLYRNPDGNPLIFDTILLEKVVDEPNITLLLNTAAFEVTKSDSDTIASVRAFCSQNSTMYTVQAPLFCDASGDGVIGFMAGAAFRMGAETAAEFDEKLAPDQAGYGELLGHSIYFYSKDVGHPVNFVPPSFALDDITKIPRYRSFNAGEDGCRLWWIEYGGRLDTVHDTEKIKWELWKVVYGVWNYIKNSGQFPAAETLTLEWVGHIPGKRESRRFEGDYMLIQHDLVEQRQHFDAVAHGGWALDLHPADGIYSEKPGCNQWHSRGMYQIPYRCLYSRNIKNLFLIGRIISASHVAFGSTRVQATLGACAQAAGMAAVLCLRDGLYPADLLTPKLMTELQQALLRQGQFIPKVSAADPADLARQATITASSQLQLAQLPPDGPLLPLDFPWAQMLPLPAGTVPHFSFELDVAEATQLQVELRTSDHPDNHTPDVILDTKTIELKPGIGQTIAVNFEAVIDQPRYGFVCLMKNPVVSVRCSSQRITGVLAVANHQNPAVSNFGKQEPTEDIGVETFEFWCPKRRPDGHNLAINIEPPLEAAFAPVNVVNGWGRPTFGSNAWVSNPDDDRPTLTLTWPELQTIARLELIFDVDFDHPLESVLMGHPETAMPFCVKHYQILDCGHQLVADVIDNHQARNVTLFDPPLVTNHLEICLLETHGEAPPALFEVRCYST